MDIKKKQPTKHTQSPTKRTSLKTKRTSLRTKRIKQNLSRSSDYFDKTKLINKHNVEFCELLLLLQILINIVFLFKMNNIDIITQKKKIKELLENLKNNNKLISSNTTSYQIQKFINNLLQYVNILLVSYISNKHKTKKHSIKNNQKNTQILYKGGFFFKNIEDKADKPITGSDVTKLLDDIQSFFNNAKYVDEGKFLVDTDAVISMLRGDTSQFKSLMNYRIFPKYISKTPPFINFDAVKQAIAERKYEDIADYLLAYQTYLRLQDEYLVEKGLKPPSALNKDLYKGVYNEFANKLDTYVLAFQRNRTTANLKGPFMIL
jgi:hypothetical protein